MTPQERVAIDIDMSNAQQAQPDEASVHFSRIGEIESMPAVRITFCRIGTGYRTDSEVVPFEQCAARCAELDEVAYNIRVSFVRQ